MSQNPNLTNIPVPVGIESVSEIPNSETCGFVEELVDVETPTNEIIPLSGEAQAQNMTNENRIVLAADSDAGVSDSAFGSNGAKFFASIQNQGTSGNSFSVDPTINVTGSAGQVIPDFFGERLETIGVWTQGVLEDQWIGFSECLDIPQDGQYWFGLAGDNQIRASLNGTTMVGNPGGGSTTVQNFTNWFVYPINLTAGENVLVLEGRNNESRNAFGCDIVGPFFPGDAGYISQISDYTTIGETQLAQMYYDNIIFSSDQKVGEYFDTQQFTCDHIVDPSTGAPADCIYNACTNECICGDAYVQGVTITQETQSVCGGTDCWTITVLDQSSGLPVSGYSISMASITTITDNNGQAVFNSLPPGTYLSSFGGVSGQGKCSEINVTLLIDFPYKRFFCVLQNLANKLIRNCDTCKDREIDQFLEIYSMYKTLELGIQGGCDKENTDRIEKALDKLVLNLDCSSCEKCL